MRKFVRKYFEVLFEPLLTLLNVLVYVGVFTILLYKFLDSEKSLQLRNFFQTYSISKEQLNLTLLNAIVTLTATFLGILLPIQLGRKLDGLWRKKLLVFGLSSLWSELRAVRDILGAIKENYTFEKTINATELPLLSKIELVSLKYRALANIVNRIDICNYNSFISNNNIAALPNDNLYNVICNTYESIEIFLTNFASTNAALSLRAEPLKRSVPFGNIEVEYGGKIQSEIDNHIKKSLEILTHTSGEVNSCIQVIENYLISLGIKHEELSL